MNHENSIPFAETVDMREQACPLPIFRMNQAMSRLRTGEVLRYITTDVCSERNLGAYLRTSGHLLVASRTEGRERVYWLVRGW